MVAVPTKLLLVLVGLPFSGKTTWATNYQSDSKIIISRDQILEAMQKDVILQSRLLGEAQKIVIPQSKVFAMRQQNAWNDVGTREYIRQVTEKIKNCPCDVVIVDGTHLAKDSRKFVAHDFGRKKIAVVITTQKDACIERWKQSTSTGIRSTISEELIEKMDTLKVLPQTEETFDEILFVN